MNHADTIPWRITGKGTEGVSYRPGGVLDLAAQWVESYTDATGLAPGVRSTHYALISLCADAGITYRNTLDAYATLSRFTAQLRRVGRFPDLSDSTREVQRPLAFEDALERLFYSAHFKLDRTLGQPIQTWIVVEKRGLAARVESWTADRGIPVVALGGFGSQTIERMVAEEIRADGRPSRGLFVADLDPSGWHLPQVFQRHVGFDSVERVALTIEQAHDLNLPSDPAPEKDSRRDRFFKETGLDAQVEVDALDALHPGVLAGAINDALDSEWDSEAHAAVVDNEWREGWKVAIARQFVQTNQ
jgi:hypothetical protein